MTCEIIDVAVEGRALNAAGDPTSFAITARVLDCKIVEIKVTTTAGTLVFHDPAFDVSSGTVDSAGYEVIEAVFQTAEGLRCGTELQVEVTCVNEPSCGFLGSLEIACDECPTDISIAVSGPGGPVDLDADCVPPGDYTVTVIQPVGPTVIYNWQIDSPSGSSTSSGPANSITVSIPQGAAAGDYGVHVFTMIPNCPFLIDHYGFPASNDGPCPEDVDIVVRSNGVVLTAPYADLAPGDYEIEVTEPVGASSYAFTENAGAASQDGASALYTVTVAAGDAVTVVVVIDNGPCCPQLVGSVTLQGAAAGDEDDDPAGGGGSGDDDTVGGGGTGTDDDEDDDNGGWSINICAILAGIAIGGLLLALVLVLLLVCGLAIGLPAIVVALVASAAAFLLLSAFCRWSACRIIGAIAWCFMWGSLIGAAIAILCLSLWVALLAVAYAIMAGLLVLWLRRMGCPIPQPFRVP